MKLYSKNQVKNSFVFACNHTVIMIEYSSLGGMIMKEKLEEIKIQAKVALEKVKELPALESFRVEYLGKKGKLTEVLRGMGSLTAEERPAIGALVNKMREDIETQVDKIREKLEATIQNAKMLMERVDVSLPGKTRPRGRVHPLSKVLDELCDIFIGLGFEIAEGPEVETDFYNFEALNIPKHHPARDSQDTFYISENILLRTQTSPVQIRTMEKTKPPIKIIAPGRVYRSDDVDATHSPIFHQIEGLVVDKGITMGDLKGTLELFTKKLYGEGISARFRPHHFQFTEPSAEMDISCPACGGKGCGVCKGEGWIEILGAGMVHPKVLQICGIDPGEYSGFAFGMGLERIAMRSLGVEDLRLFYENDVRFLEQL